jgi:hypothetical protein
VNGGKGTPNEEEALAEVRSDRDEDHVVAE